MFVYIYIDINVLYEISKLINLFYLLNRHWAIIIKQLSGVLRIFIQKIW